MAHVPFPPGMEDWVELIRVAPTDPNLRVRFAAELIRFGHFDHAERELTTCLEVAPAQARPRLLVAVLKARAKMAARRSALVQADLQQQDAARVSSEQ
jgi:Flp pilus assembly protein TadD